MNQFTKYPHLFSPIKIGKLTVKNRIEIPPMGINLGRSDGYVTAEYYLWVKRLAKSGAGIVTVSDAGIDFDLAGGNVAGPRLDSEDKIPGLSRLVDEVHRYHAAASIELTHYGVVANPALVRPLGSTLMSSSDVIWDVDGKPTLVAREMTHQQISQVIEHYCAAAKLCQAAGFDMIMIHGAHGQLPAQFLSPVFNHRRDEYGGSPENRMRFPLELLAALRAALGPDYPIEYRISGDEVAENGLRLEDTLAFLEKAQQYIDLVHFSVGIDPKDHGTRFMPSYLEPHNVNLSFAEAAKKRLHIPVAVVGGISYHEDGEQMIAQGKTDIVAMGRATICDPEGHRKAELGLEQDIRPCMRCGSCGRVSRQMGMKTVLCALNPTAGRELEYMRIYPAPKPKKVMIVGGGPAGMQAAITAAERGHQVSLYEASDRLGGMLNVAMALPFKQDMRRSVQWLIRKAMDCGAEIHLSTPADARLVGQLAPDALILAVGAHPFVPDIPGKDLPQVVWAGDIDAGQVRPGHRVVVIGAGLTGVECGAQLAAEGHKVTIVDTLPLERWCAGAGSSVLPSLLARLSRTDAELLPGVGVDRIEVDGVVISMPEGRRRKLPADTVAMATGMRADRQTTDRLSGLVRDTYIVGDCERAGTIMNAIHGGFQAAVDL